MIKPFETLSQKPCLLGVWKAVEEKAREHGAPIIYVNPKNTSRNPWFSFRRRALSDLGDARSATDPWMYNTGLIVVAAVLRIYSLYIAYESKRKLVVFSSALLFTAGIFLALVGVFPSGTRPHVFVSTWLFIQVWLSSIPLLIDSIASRKPST